MSIIKQRDTYRMFAGSAIMLELLERCCRNEFLVLHSPVDYMPDQLYWCPQLQMSTCKVQATTPTVCHIDPCLTTGHSFKCPLVNLWGLWKGVTQSARKTVSFRVLGLDSGSATSLEPQAGRVAPGAACSIVEMRVCWHALAASHSARPEAGSQ